MYTIFEFCSIKFQKREAEIREKAIREKAQSVEEQRYDCVPADKVIKNQLRGRVI